MRSWSESKQQAHTNQPRVGGATPLPLLIGEKMSDYKKINIDPDEYKEPKPSKPGNVVKSETKDWPPRIGIWKGGSRNRCLGLMRLDPNEELVVDIVPSPGFILNGVGLLGKQALPRNTWQMIKHALSAQEANEEVFIRGGKEKTRMLGKYRG